MVASSTSATGLKGRPPLRKCPDDFDVVFVEQGRLACESWYRARRDTVNRWLEERGKDRLIEQRAAFVAHQRSKGQWITRSTKLIEHREARQAAKRLPIRDRRKVHPTLARRAAQHLRISRNGSFIVSPAGDEEWWVGSRRMSSAQMVDFAESKGFDRQVDDGETGEEREERVQKLTLIQRGPQDLGRARYLEEWSDRLGKCHGSADLDLGRNWQEDDDPTALQAGGRSEVKP